MQLYPRVEGGMTMSQSQSSAMAMMKPLFIMVPLAPMRWGKEVKNNVVHVVDLIIIPCKAYVIKV